MLKCMSSFLGKLEAVHLDLKLLKSLVFILGSEFIKTVLHIGEKIIAGFSKNCREVQNFTCYETNVAIF